MRIFKELWLIIRDEITYFWLIKVCDMPDVAVEYGKRSLKE